MTLNSRITNCFGAHASRCVSAMGITIGLAFFATIGVAETMPGGDVDQQVASPATTATRAQLDYFERHVRPILSEHCHACHSETADAAGELRAGLRLDTSRGWLQGGDSGPAVVPGDAQASLLIQAVQYDADVSPMPPDEKLDDAVVRRLITWVKNGAVAPQPSVSVQPGRDADDPAQSLDHWAFTAPRPARLSPLDRSMQNDRASTSQSSPAVTQTNQSPACNRIDALISAKLQEVGLAINEPASDHDLVRRLYFDLIGLPPTFAEANAFQGTKSPAAYEQLVDRLLASPRFGERWGRHWLDVARFADTKGYVFREDRKYRDAHKYREWVIQAWNEDRPYDDFVRYQLAADKLAGDDPDELAAMGFLTLGRRFLNNRHDIIDDRIDVTMRGFMGLTVTCARCHDHKYDPIPSADYYSLYGVFASSEEPRDLPSPLRLVDKEALYEPVVFLRGKPGRRGERVPRQFLQLVAGPQRQPFQHGSGRLEMANAIVARDNPLTARVIVNRIWGQLMGSYLVDTPSDFGTRSQQPLHHRLLDDLAVRLIEHDWSLKWLVRQIVTSSTYQQSSHVTQTMQAHDPVNQRYSRANRKRLDFEAMRDAFLQVSGEIDMAEIGGKSVDIVGDAPRRAIYAHIDRQNFPSLFRTFDVAAPDTHSPKRFSTTVPQQALYLLNNPFTLDCAQAVAATTRQADSTNSTRGEPPRHSPGNSVVDRQLRITRLFRRCLSRNPTDRDVERAEQFLNQSAVDFAGNSGDMEQRWAQLAQILLISNEFFFLD